MGRFDSIYAHLPVWIQHQAVTAYGVYWYFLRFGPGSSTCMAEFASRERWNRSQWLQWQKQQLAVLLPLAAQHVPYYRDTWNQSQKSAALAGDLEALPLLDKEPLRATPKAFLRRDRQLSRMHVFYTSGSTGTPIAAYYTTAELRRSMALREVRSARWAGVSFKAARATFSGRLIEPNPDSAGPYYRFNADEKQVYFSPFHLRPDSAALYLRALEKHHVSWLTGYAVSYYLLAKFVLEKKLVMPALKAVITTSEKVTPEMRQVMETAYQCKVYEEYSTVENALFASECEHGRLHVSPDAGIVEILRPDGSPCDLDEPGEVVATGLIRTYQPFIRYRLGDIAMWDSEACPCGREMPIIKEVIGRVEDVVIGPDGRQMVRFHGIFVNQPHVREGQIIQEAISRIRVKIVPTDGYSQDDERDIQHRIQQRLGNSVKVVIELVEFIPRNKAGKFRAVICELSDAEKHNTIAK